MLESVYREHKARANIERRRDCRCVIVPPVEELAERQQNPIRAYYFGETFGCVGVISQNMGLAEYLEDIVDLFAAIKGHAMMFTIGWLASAV